MAIRFVHSGGARATPGALVLVASVAACASFPRAVPLGAPVTTCPVGAPAVRAGARAELIPAWYAPRIVGREGTRTLVIAGSLRAEVDGAAVRWGEGRFAGAIDDAWRDARGWRFSVRDGTRARADTFLGPLRPADPELPQGVGDAGWDVDRARERQVEGELPLAGGDAYERLRWGAFARYRLWLRETVRALRDDGGAIGLALDRPGDPWSAWRVDGATGCVTHAPLRLPGAAEHFCRGAEVQGFYAWGGAVAVLSVAGDEARLHALGDDLAITDLGPLPIPPREPDRVCGWRPSLRFADDGVHAELAPCDGCRVRYAFDRRDGAWREIAPLPAPAERPAFTAARAPAVSRVQMFDALRGVAQSDAPPDRVYRWPSMSSYAEVGALPDLWRTNDGGRRWTAVEVRATGAPRFESPTGPMEVACSRSFCVADDRLLFAAGDAAETPGEDVLAPPERRLTFAELAAFEPRPPPPPVVTTAPDGTQTFTITGDLVVSCVTPPPPPLLACDDPAEVIDALRAALPTLGACRTIHALFDDHGRYAHEPPAPDGGDPTRSCVDALAAALTRPMPSRWCSVRARLRDGELTFDR